MAASEQPEPLRFSNERKLQRQMQRKGWTEEAIREALATPGIPSRGKRGPAMRHVHPETGCRLVIDAKTGEIFHVGDKDFEYE